MEIIFHAIKDYGTQAIGLVLAWLLHKAISEVRALRETRMKAELAFDEVSARVPAVKEKYDFWLAHL